MMNYKKLTILFIFALIINQIQFSLAEEETMIEPNREFRGAWIATVANIDWPSERGLSSDQQKKELITMLDVATSIHLNAILFQIRPEADALYESKLEPWSRFLSGKQGEPPNPYYDPLEFIIEECHNRGLELHAWFNPYRASYNSKSDFADNHVSKTLPDVVYRYDKYLWMDPGREETMQHTLDVIMDVVKRYDVDGIHFDDYFYPYPVKDVPFPDENTYADYTSNGGELNRDNWRRENVNRMVKLIYENIKKEKPLVKFGISPFGIWRPGYPEGIAGLDAYASLYADSKKWLQEGWLDYFTPQLYWAIHAPQQSYPRLLEWWIEQNKWKRHIYPGHKIYSIGTGEKEWPVSEAVNQIKISREKGAEGIVLYNFSSLMKNPLKLREALRNDCFSKPALIPKMPWKDAIPPTPPGQVSAQLSGETKIEIKWSLPTDLDIRYWGIYKKVDDSDWELLKIIPSAQISFLDSFSGIRNQKVIYGVSAIDRIYNESVKSEASLF